MQMNISHAGVIAVEGKKWKNGAFWKTSPLKCGSCKKLGVVQLSQSHQHRRRPLSPRFFNVCPPPLPLSIPLNARSTQCMLEPQGIVHQLSAKAKKNLKNKNNEAGGWRLTYNREERERAPFIKQRVFCTKGARHSAYSVNTVLRT